VGKVTLGIEEGKGKKLFESSFENEELVKAPFFLIERNNKMSSLS
jgi:hypothetical protein